jgi:hypothetical protein
MLQPKSFSAEKDNQGKEVISMTYTKPAITKLAEAAVAICSEDSMIKSALGADVGNPHRQTAPAYAAED